MLNRRIQFVLSAIGILLISALLIYSLSFVTYDESEPFKVELNLFERLICMTLWPAEGNFATLKIVRDMQMQLAPSDEEYKLAGLKNDLITGELMAENGWLVVEKKEIIFGDIAKGLIVGALERLDEAEKLTNDYFSLYEKFVVGEKKEGD